MTEGATSDVRTFTSGRRVFLGDASMSGRLRLDSLARFLQDLATNDAEDADDVADDRGWILRRMELDVRRLPSIYEDLELTTWCSGVGGRWAERSTSLADTREVFGGECVMARAVWVLVSLETGAPMSLPANFFAVYGEGARAHNVSAKLKHPAPPPDAKRRPWPVRITDFDVFGHVNNAVYWSAVEDELPDWLDGRRVGHCEIEFKAGIDPGDVTELLVHTGEALSLWFVVGDEVRASVVVRTQ
ncbi:MAG: acyl-[acyl-carrier-protein] thioesterase [Acidimicrobiia bacterium]